VIGQSGSTHVVHRVPLFYGQMYSDNSFTEAQWGLWRTGVPTLLMPLPRSQRRSLNLGLGKKFL